MKNGIETRDNGNQIYKDICKSGFVLYHVYLKAPCGSYVASKNGPWDYLNNARKAADEEMLK